MLLSLKDIYIEYNNRVILDHIDLNVTSHSKIGLIGLNGAGKSTLLKLLADFDSLSESHVMYDNNLKVSYLNQDVKDFNTENIIEYVIDNEISLHDESLIYQAQTILNKLGIDDITCNLSSLSGGQKKRVALAKTLLQEVDLLILDEPTNHLDSTMIEWLENYLIRSKCALVMVSHDRYFLERIVNQIVEVDKGYIYIYPGNYSKYLDLKAQRLSDEEASHRKQISLLKREEVWIKQGPRARSTKSKDRIARYEQLKDDVIQEQASQLELESVGTRLGKKILEIENLSIGYDDNILISDFNYIFKRTDRIGLVGLNGSGKSTLLNVLAQQIQPLSGTLDYGATVKIGYFNQHSYDLDDSSRVIDYIKDKAEYIDTTEGEVSASVMLERFLFDSHQQYSLIETLSGGEKRRLLLLGVLMEAPNLLILDEPTNDLDITTLTILEDYLDHFNGVVLIVSHDRYFMDKIVESLWIIDNKHIAFSNDDYTLYLKQANKTRTKMEVLKPVYEKKKRIRFSYQEQKDLETIDADMEVLQSNIAELSKQMAAYATDYEKLSEIQTIIDDNEEKLEIKTLRWLELQEKQEHIDNQE